MRPSDDIPPFLLPLRERAAAFAGIAAGIGWHRDKSMFEDVVAISLGSTCSLRLRRRQGSGWERAAQEVRPRSAYLLRGAPVRREWEHSVPAVDCLRYSVTFRNFVAGWAA